MHAPLALQEKQSDIDALTVTVQEKDAIIQSLTEQMQQRQYETKGRYIHVHAYMHSHNYACKHRKEKRWCHS